MPSSQKNTVGLTNTEDRLFDHQCPPTSKCLLPHKGSGGHEQKSSGAGAPATPVIDERLAGIGPGASNAGGADASVAHLGRQHEDGHEERLPVGRLRAKGTPGFLRDRQQSRRGERERQGRPQQRVSHRTKPRPSKGGTLEALRRCSCPHFDATSPKEAGTIPTPSVRNTQEPASSPRPNTPPRHATPLHRSTAQKHQRSGSRCAGIAFG